MAIGSGIDAQLGASDEVYANEVQSLAITGTPTGGSLTFSIDGATTGAAAYNSTFGQVQTLLDALPFGAGQIVAAGGPWPGTPITLTFSGSNVAKRNIPAAVIVTNSLTGGTAPTLAVTTPTPGTGYGDYVAPSRFFEFTQVGVKAKVDRIESKAWRAGQLVGPRADRWASNKTGAGGPIVLEGLTKSLGFWLKDMFGPAVTTTPVGGTLTRDHTMALADLFNRSKTIQGGFPMAADVPSVQPFTWVGCKIAGWEISCDVDGILQIKLDIDAKDEDTTRSLAGTSYPTGLELLTYIGGQVTIGGKNHDLKNWTLQRSSAMNTDRRYIRKDTTKREPILNGVGGASGKFDIEFATMWHYQQFISGTTWPMVATFEGPTVIEGALKPMLQVTIPAIRFDGETPDVGSPDIIMQSVPYTVVAPADGSPAMTCVYRTTDTTP